MTCCASNTASRRFSTCPVNGKRYGAVARKTVLHQIRSPWSRDLSIQHYFFCTDPHCEVVYFGEDNSQLLRDELRESAGQKSNHPHTTICYCFDIKLSDIQRSPQQCKQFVVEQTRHSQCDCQVRNPSGKCCLKDFPQDPLEK